MQRFKARLTRDASGDWIAAAVELPNCWSRGGSRDEAIAKLRQEIRYRIEYCPCTGVGDDFVHVDVIGEAGAGEPVARATTATTAPAIPAGGDSAPAALAASRGAGAVADWRGVAGCPGGPRPRRGAQLPPDTRRPRGPQLPSDMRPRRPSRWAD